MNIFMKLNKITQFNILLKYEPNIQILWIEWKRCKKGKGEGHENAIRKKMEAGSSFGWSGNIEEC